jgi:alpha-L-rhamnosidase
MQCCFHALLMLTVSIATSHATADIRVTNPRCENLANPLGVDVTEPRLSWVLTSDQRGQKQTAYRVLVASSPDELDKDLGDLWDTGRVESNQSIHVPYAGKPLQSRMRCHWKVRVWGKDGKPSNWSEVAEWSMGLLKAKDWKAKWITRPAAEKLSHPWFRRTFDLKGKTERAEIYVNAGSYFELRINGRKVGPYVLTPGVCKTDKRFHINTYDVTELLVEGENCIAVWMGPGWHQKRMGNKYNAPLLRAQLHVDSSAGHTVIGTDARWRVNDSCITQIGGWKWNNFGGERYDARAYEPGWDQIDFDDSKWSVAAEIPAPAVVNSWQACESARLGDPIKPKRIYAVANGKWVVDFGRPLTGWMRLRMRGLKAGQEVKLVYADIHKGDFPTDLTFMSDANGFQTFNQKDKFISAGEPEETFCSKFNYHSFRYAVIDGLAERPSDEDAEAMMIEPELESAGSFECSNDLFNQIYEITRYTLRTQNPCLALGTGEAREKSAYGDGGAHLSGYLYNFHCQANFRKWLVDWSDNQREDGFFGHTAPAFEDHGGGPAWGGQATALVKRLYLYYGDKLIVEQMYDRLRRYVDFVESKTRDGILRSYTPTRRSVGWMFIGDWARPYEDLTQTGFNMDEAPEREFFNNCYRVVLWEQLQCYADVLGRTEERERCRRHLAKIRPLIHKTYYLPDNGVYRFHNQSALAIALYARISPSHMRPQLLAKLEELIRVEKKGHLDTGLLGTFILLDLLIQEDRNDLIALMMQQTTYPGWGYLVKELGVKTWSETWSGWGSHVILVTATPGSWFFEGLGGILPDPKNPGFKHFKLRPGIVKHVDWVKCNYQSPYGQIVSNWKLENDSFTWDIRVPPSTTATVYLPTTDADSVKESGLPAAKAPGVKLLRIEDGRAVYEVDAGSYRFKSRLSTRAKQGSHGVTQ